ncbi:hypothetical protein DV515_00002455, partial [Chloebia gouldiae]
MAGVCEQFMAQLDHQAVCIENLERMSQHGCNVWTLYNEPLGAAVGRSTGIRNHSKGHSALKLQDTHLPGTQSWLPLLLIPLKRFPLNFKGNWISYLAFVLE